MNYLINIKQLLTILSLLLIHNNIHADEITEIIFTIKGQVYTTEDLNKRITYLKLKDANLNIIKAYAKKDFISAVIFREFSKNKLSIEDKIIDDYYNSFFGRYQNLNESNEFNLLFKSLTKREINLNLKMDLIRKIILEDLLNNKNKNKYKIINEIDISDIYLINVEYYSINLEDDKNIKKNKIEINFENIDKTNKDLTKYNVDYIYEKKNNVKLRNLHKEFRNSFKKNINYLNFKIGSNIIYGKIDKNIKFENEILLNLIEIKNVDQKNIDFFKKSNCKEFKNIENKINTFKEIKYSELQDKLKKYLKVKNDIYIIKNNTELNLIKLCNITFNDEIIKNFEINYQVGNIVKIIEREFIQEFSKKYEFNIIINE